VGIVLSEEVEGSVKEGEAFNRGRLTMEGIKHVKWEAVEGDGLIAVVVENNIITFRKLAGSKPQASYLLAILDAAVPGWRERAEALHLVREQCWFVETRTNNFGGVNVILKVIRDYSLRDVPTVARLHINHLGKVSSFKLWLGDLAPLAAEVKRLFPQAVLSPAADEDGVFRAETLEGERHSVRLTVYVPKDVETKKVRFPGDPSGLIEEHKPEPEEAKLSIILR